MYIAKAQTGIKPKVLFKTKGDVVTQITWNISNLWEKQSLF